MFRNQGPRVRQRTLFQLQLRGHDPARRGTFTDANGTSEYHGVRQAPMANPILPRLGKVF
jgi:hypothetical protein